VLAEVASFVGPRLKKLVVVVDPADVVGLMNKVDVGDPANVNVVPSNIVIEDDWSMD